VNGICTKCVPMSFLNGNATCQLISESCRTYNDINGYCLTCYSGYSLNKNGQCLQNNPAVGCKTLDANGICVQCSSGYYIDANNACVAIDPQCAQFDSVNKVCTSCYNGYSLLLGVCQISQVNNQYKVNNCFVYNSNNQCIQCLNRYFLTNNQCKDVNVFCKTYDLNTGLCTGCYSTFILTNGQCNAKWTTLIKLCLNNFCFILSSLFII
jgi:hypothetical protein